MKKANKALAALLALTMVTGSLAGCGSSNGSGKTETAPATEGATETADADASASGADTLVASSAHFEGKFSPFFAASAEDQHIVDMTQIGLLGSDRQGAIVEKGIEGETRSYNGTDYTYYTASDLKMTQNDDGSVYYDVTIRDDLTFSDGTPITIDDVIFSMYVYCDPTYDGCNSLQPADPWSGGVPGRYGNPGFPDRSSRRRQHRLLSVDRRSADRFLGCSK